MLLVPILPWCLDSHNRLHNRPRLNEERKAVRDNTTFLICQRAMEVHPDVLLPRHGRDQSHRGQKEIGKVLDPVGLSPCEHSFSAHLDVYFRLSHSASVADDFWYSIRIFHPPGFFTSNPSKWMYFFLGSSPGFWAV